jgi:hypothetical protein
MVRRVRRNSMNRHKRHLSEVHIAPLRHHPRGQPPTSHHHHRDGHGQAEDEDEDEWRRRRGMGLGQSVDDLAAPSPAPALLLDWDDSSPRTRARHAVADPRRLGGQGTGGRARLVSSINFGSADAASSHHQHDDDDDDHDDDDHAAAASHRRSLRQSMARELEKHKWKRQREQGKLRSLNRRQGTSLHTHAPRTTHHAPRTTHHAPRITHHTPHTRLYLTTRHTGSSLRLQKNAEDTAKSGVPFPGIALHIVHEHRGPAVITPEGTRPPPHVAVAAVETCQSLVCFRFRFCQGNHIRSYACGGRDI